jgi:hypothetical protein
VEHGAKRMAATRRKISEVHHGHRVLSSRR